MEARAPAHCTLDVNKSLMFLNDTEYDREPKPCSFSDFLCRKERFKDTGSCRLIHSAAGIRTYPPAPTTFGELVKLIPPRGAANRYRFTAADRPFELQIGRNEANIVHLSFSAPDDRTTFWPCIRTIESLTSQRAVWSRSQRFLEDPDSYLTWKSVGAQE